MNFIKGLYIFFNIFRADQQKRMLGHFFTPRYQESSHFVQNYMGFKDAIKGQECKINDIKKIEETLAKAKDDLKKIKAKKQEKFQALLLNADGQFVQNIDLMDVALGDANDQNIKKQKRYIKNVINFFK